MTEMIKLKFQELPTDILTIIFQYTPAECLLLRTMSRSLRKAVSKSGYSIYLMHLFYMNQYGYTLSTNEDIRDIDISQKYTDEICSFMYKCGEPIKHIYVRNHRNYIKLCLKNNDLNSAIIMTMHGEDDGNNDDDDDYRDLIDKHMLKSGLKPYRVSSNDPFIITVSKMVIRRGIKDDEIPIILKNHKPSYVYEALKVGSYNFADQLMIYMSNNCISMIDTFIKYDDVLLLELFLKRYDRNIDHNYNKNSVILRYVYKFDSVEIFKYLCKNDKYIELIHDHHITTEIMPKIAKYMVLTNIDVVFNYEKCFMNNYLDWRDIFIPNSDIFKAICTMEPFYPKIKINFEELYTKLGKTIIDNYYASLITPHPYPFVNKLLSDLFELIKQKNK